MGRKIFISYKYSDNDVYGSRITVRDYVDKLRELLNREHHVNKSESDDMDLSDLEDDTIQQKLADRIYDSTVTIVMISPNMKEPGVSQKKQWIPWEVSYSLKIKNRQKGGRSYPNAILAIVLPDSNNSYEYYIQDSCPQCKSRTYKKDTLFPILGKNTFNIKNPQIYRCHHQGPNYFTGEYSYILATKWNEFISDINHYIDRADSISDNIDDYNVVKELE